MVKMKRICITEKQYDEVLDTLYKGTRFVRYDDDCVDEGLFWMHPADIGTDSFDFGILEACITDRNVFPIVFIRKNGNIGYVKVFYNPVFVGCDFLNEEEVNFIYDIVSEITKGESHKKNTCSFRTGIFFVGHLGLEPNPYNS